MRFKDWASLVSLAVAVTLVVSLGFALRTPYQAEAALGPRGLAVGNPVAITVTTGDTTPTASWCTIAAAGDLSRLWAGAGYAIRGDVLILSTSVDANDVTVWDGVATSGSMVMLELGAASRALDNSLDKLGLMYDGTVWVEIFFVSNGT